MPKQRLVYIDILRAFAIILVVMGHLLNGTGEDNKFLSKIIYSFHMPLFMCISGFVTAYTSDFRYEEKSWRMRMLSTGRYIRKKFNHIMLPYIVWPCLVFPFFFSTYKQFPDYGDIFHHLFIINDSFWFLPCLFGLCVCFAFYRLGRSWCKRDSVFVNLFLLGGIACILGGAYTFTKWDPLRSVISYFLPFFMGMLMGQYPSVYRNLCDNRNVYTIALFLLPLVAGLYIRDNDAMYGKAARLICGCAAIPLCFYLFKNLVFSPWVTAVLGYIGRNTLIIYILHWCGIPSWDLHMYHIPNYLKLLVYPVWSLLIIIPILGINFVLEQSPLARCLLLGRK